MSESIRMPVEGAQFVRQALAQDAEAITALVNRAFHVEESFCRPPRITLTEIAQRLGSGIFLLHEDAARLIGCVYLELRPGHRGYIGLLGVDPGLQRRGLGPRLMKAAEDRLSALGCTVAELTVVNVRSELFPFYERLGYRRRGELPFPGPSTRPCHLVLMGKELRSTDGLSRSG